MFRIYVIHHQGV